MFKEIKVLIRNLLWRLLGVDYNQILKVIDYVYLKEDRYTQIGKRSYSNNALVFRWGKAPIIIGKYSTIAEGVRFIVDQGKHHVGCVSTYPFKGNSLGKKEGIIIGNDVWIGANSTILPGVKIGNGVTVAAGSVVTKDIADYSMVGGVPARVLKMKCTAADIRYMNEIAWWDWSDEQISLNEQDFKLSIPEFIAKYGKDSVNND